MSGQNEMLSKAEDIADKVSCCRSQNARNKYIIWSRTEILNPYVPEFILGLPEFNNIAGDEEF